MKIKTSDLIGPALDWAVDWALSGHALKVMKHPRSAGLAYYDPVAGVAVLDGVPNFSTSWQSGGPIIERENISLISPTEDVAVEWEARSYPVSSRNWVEEFGPTPLIAAMRCFVASKLGDEVDVPEELL